MNEQIRQPIGSGTGESIGRPEDSYLRDRALFASIKKLEIQNIRTSLEDKSPKEKLSILTSSLYANNEKKIPEEQSRGYASDPANAKQEAIMQVYSDTIRGFSDLRPDIVAGLYACTYTEYLGNSLVNGMSIDDFSDGTRPTIMPSDMPGQLFLILEQAVRRLAENNNPHTSTAYSYQYFEAIKETVRCSFSGERPKPNKQRFGERYFSEDPEIKEAIDVGYLKRLLDNDPQCYGYSYTPEQDKKFLEGLQEYYDELDQRSSGK